MIQFGALSHPLSHETEQKCRAGFKQPIFRSAAYLTHLFSRRTDQGVGAVPVYNDTQ